ncbi:MAG: hypothetical protein R3F37_00460 [Candidatus Competibacteraceae bacterium]
MNIVFPNQDSSGTHVNISGMVLTNAPNQESAVRLMEFLSGGDLAQQMYAEQNYEYPVNPGVPWSGLLNPGASSRWIRYRWRKSPNIARKRPNWWTR